MPSRVIAFTGIRDIAPRMVDVVELAVLEEVGCGATELRFGGEIGADMLALEAAAECCEKVRRVVYVPFTIREQPEAARRAIRRYADDVVELGRPPETRNAYLQRNRKMIDGADSVVAFTDGRAKGGTANTIRAANRAGVEVYLVEVWSAALVRARLRANVRQPLRRSRATRSR